MAGFEVNFPDDFMSGLLEANVDDICKEALQEAAPILVKSMKKAVNSVTKEYATKEAAESITAKTPKKTKTGDWIVNVNPTGYSNVRVSFGKVRTRSKKIANALKLLWLDKGIVGHQAARPFLQNATKAAEKEVIEKIQEIYEKKVGGKN